MNEHLGKISFSYRLPESMGVVSTHTGEWRDSKSLPQCMLHMLEKEIMCDVTFKVGKDKTRLNAHKYMLSSRSPVFYTMFEGSLPETGEIDIPDIDTETFNTVLRYIYSDEINISNENVEEILYAADKYMLARLKRGCEKRLNKTAKTEHATKAFQIACTYSLTDLKQESFNYIELNTKKCLSSDHAISLPREHLELIFKSDFLDCSETDICSFFLKWAHRQCTVDKLEVNSENLRDVAGSILYLVRFPVIDMKYFSNEVSKTGLLKPEEIISIYQSHFGEKSRQFLDRPRCPVAKRTTYAFSRYGSTTNPWANTGVEALVFSTDVDIWVKGVNIFSPVNHGNGFGYYQNTTFKCSVIVGILDEAKREVNSSSVEILNGQYDYSPIYPVCFTIPTLIKARHKYTLKMTGLTVKTFFGQDCKNSVTENGVTITFENSPICMSGTTTQRGQFGGILFSV